jgi:hypothetical protein
MPRKSDSAIAAEFGLSANTVLYWRHKNGLKANCGNALRRKNNQPPHEDISQGDGKIPPQHPPEKEPAAEIVWKLPADLKPAPSEEAAKAATAQRPSPSSGVNKLVYLPGENDPLVFDAFDQAIVMLYHAGAQPSMIWRKLLLAVEKHITALGGYLAQNEDACSCAVRLAALAAVEEVAGR